LRTIRLKTGVVSLLGYCVIESHADGRVRKRVHADFHFLSVREQPARGLTVERVAGIESGN
jgi:hypothetical protein